VARVWQKVEKNVRETVSSAMDAQGEEEKQRKEGAWEEKMAYLREKQT